MSASSSTAAESSLHAGPSTSTAAVQTDGASTSDAAPPAPTTAPATAASQTDKRHTEARAAVTASLSSVGSGYDSELAARAADLHSNARSIAAQEAGLARQTAALVRRADTLEKVIGGATNELKAIGDVQNWAETIEHQLLVLEETMRLVEERKAGGGAEAGPNGETTST